VTTAFFIKTLDNLLAAAFSTLAAPEQGAVQLIVFKPPIWATRSLSAEAIRAPSREAFCACCPVKNASPKSAGIHAITSKRTNVSVNSTAAWPLPFKQLPLLNNCFHIVVFICTILPYVVDLKLLVLLLQFVLWITLQWKSSIPYQSKTIAI